MKRINLPVCLILAAAMIVGVISVASATDFEDVTPSPAKFTKIATEPYGIYAVFSDGSVQRQGTLVQDTVTFTGYTTVTLCGGQVTSILSAVATIKGEPDLTTGTVVTTSFPASGGVLTIAAYKPTAADDCTPTTSTASITASYVALVQ